MADEKRLDLSPAEALKSKGFSRSTAFICPYPDCGVYAQHHWGVVNNLSTPVSSSVAAQRVATNNPYVWLASCEACARELIFADTELVWPVHCAAPIPSADMPEDARSEFNEARKIYRSSPRGAAALLRLSLEKMLPALGATQSSINDSIGELVKNGIIPASVQQALDSVRVIGNEAVHPGELDLRDDEATVLALFGLLNFIVEKVITEPKRVAAIYESLPAAKLKGIADRDKAKPAEC